MGCWYVVYIRIYSLLIGLINPTILYVIGKSQGSSNELDYMAITHYTAGRVEAYHSLFADGTKLYSTLRCFNGAGLEAKLSTNGFTIVNEPPKSKQGSVTLIYPQYTPFPKRGEYQATAGHVQFYWEGFMDVTGLESYECRIAGKLVANSIFDPSLSLSHISTYLYTLL